MLFNLEMGMPTIQCLETWKPTVFFAAVREGDLVAQSGASDLGIRFKSGSIAFRLFLHCILPSGLDEEG
jgi:hypothetical protein